MKTTSKNLTTVFASVIFVLFTLGVSLNALAQDKPMGKPWPAPESAEKMKNPVKPPVSKEAKDLYAQHCKSCHGAKGKGDGPKAEKIDISCGDFASADFTKQSDGAIYWKITEGRKPMPSFKEKLSDSERWELVNYLRSMSK